MVSGRGSGVRGNGATERWHCQGFLAVAAQHWHCQGFLARTPRKPPRPGTANDFWHLPLSIGAARDFWRGGPRCHSALALPTFSDVRTNLATQVWHCQGSLARRPPMPPSSGTANAFGPDSVSLAPPRGARSPHVPRDLPRGTADVAEHLKGDFPSAAPVPLVAAYSKYAAAPQGFTRRPRPALPRHSSVFPRA